MGRRAETNQSKHQPPFPYFTYYHSFPSIFKRTSTLFENHFFFVMVVVGTEREFPPSVTPTFLASPVASRQPSKDQPTNNQPTKPDPDQIQIRSIQASNIDLSFSPPNAQLWYS
jgi:hypothetical protein